jgi:hypothetical protein
MENNNFRKKGTRYINLCEKFHIIVKITGETYLLRINLSKNEQSEQSKITIQ